MPELVFKGKEFVYNHHLSVPYQPLVSHPDRSIGAGTLDGNLIIHGDNLKALKALLPHYAGKIDCVFIDPPYNTGTESWCYNDNVNSPMMREWFDNNPVTKEDMLRHDKWLCMMYPRFKLLHELLAPHGSLWMTLDDNEQHRAQSVLDEIFGEQNFLATVIWEKADSPRMDADYFSTRHDYVLAYAKEKASVVFHRVDEEEEPPHYNQEDEAGRKYYLKPLRAMGGQGETREARPNLYFGLKAPDGTEVFPKLQDGSDGAWRWSPKKVATDGDRIEWKKGTNGWTPYYRIYADTAKGRPPETIFYNSDVGSSRTAKAELKELFPEGCPFDTPKPVGLVKAILQIATNPDATILDSFAGSGTTGHAVLSLNKDDAGKRKFVLVEQEDYADGTTAERVRRVINGYTFSGTEKEELFRSKLTFNSLKSADKLLDKITAVENLENHRFDKITKSVDGGDLVVVGEKAITDKKEPLGGTLSFVSLGEPTDLNKILLGENLPDYAAIGSWLFHTATGEAIAAPAINEAEWYLGESSAYFVWLVYKPDLKFLKSRESALTLELAEKLSKTKKGKKHLVFAPSKFVPNKLLLPLGVEHVTLPFGLFRIEKS